MSTRTLVTTILALLFMGIFVFRIDSSPIGPTSAEEVDDIGITRAYLDPASNSLLLFTATRWARLDLAGIQRQNAELRSTVAPRDGNFLHWKSFSDGQPSAALSHLEPVAVCTWDYASFNYKGDGKAWKNHEQAAQPPANFRYALFRSSPEVAEDNRTWFKSYLLQTPSPGADGRFGIQFFYHPDYRYRIAFQHPAFLALFGPSFIALCIALPLAFSRVRIGPAMALFTLAALFHVASFLLFLVGVRYGEAWSGYGPAHNSPFVHLVIGLGVLLVLILIRLSPRTTKSA